MCWLSMFCYFIVCVYVWRAVLFLWRVYADVSICRSRCAALSSNRHLCLTSANHEFIVFTSTSLTTDYVDKRTSEAPTVSVT